MCPPSCKTKNLYSIFPGTRLSKLPWELGKIIVSVCRLSGYIYIYTITSPDLHLGKLNQVWCLRVGSAHNFFFFFFVLYMYTSYVHTVLYTTNILLYICAWLIIGGSEARLRFTSRRGLGLPRGCAWGRSNYLPEYCTYIPSSSNLWSWVQRSVYFMGRVCRYIHDIYTSITGGSANKYLESQSLPLRGFWLAGR